MRSKLRRSLEWLSFVACLAFSVYSCERIALCCLSKQPSQRGASSRKWRPHTSLPPFVSRWVKKLQETFSGFRCNNSKMIALKLSLTYWKKTGLHTEVGRGQFIWVLKAHEPQQKILKLHCSHCSGTCNQIIQAFYCFYRLDPINPVFFCVCFNVHQWNSNNYQQLTL